MRLSARDTRMFVGHIPLSQARDCARLLTNVSHPARRSSYHYDVDFRIADLDKDIKWNKDDASRAWAAFAASQPNQAGAIRAVRRPTDCLSLLGARDADPDPSSRTSDRVRRPQERTSDALA
jgi:hypothetical protein